MRARLRALFRPLLWTACFLVPWLAVAAARGDSQSRNDTRHGRRAISVFTDEDGLPQNAITAIVFDRVGRIWIGTKDGAAYYNGHVWRVVALPRESGSNWVTAIVETGDGSLWFGTESGGIARLRAEAWTTFKIASGLPSDTVYCLLETTSDGVGGRALWAGTEGGLARFGESGRWETVPEVTAPVHCLLETQQDGGTLWAGTWGNGVAALQGGGWRMFEPDGQDALDPFVPDLVEDDVLFGRREVLAAFESGTIARFTGSGWERYTGPLEIPPNIRCMRSVVEPNGTKALWIGSLSDLRRFTAGGATVFTTASGLPSNRVWSLSVATAPDGRAHTMWIGTAGSGLARWRRGAWVAYDASMLPDASVYSFAESVGPDGAATYWLGTNEGNLLRSDGGAWESVESDEKLSTVLCLHETRWDDGRRTLWVGTSLGMRRWDAGRWSRPFGRETTFPASIYAFLETRAPDGARVLLVGTAEGLRKIVDGRLAEPVPEISLPHPVVRCLAQTEASDGSRILWIGTGGGLVRYENGRSTVYTAAQGGLPNDIVTSVLPVVSPSGRAELWIGTRTGGLAVLDLDAPEPSWRVMSTVTTPSLPNNTVYQIRRDAMGRLYVSTNAGVARLTPASNGGYSVYVFTTEDGLPSNECNTGASMVDARGRIWIGTIAGVAVFDPLQEIPDDQPKPLRLERAEHLGPRRGPIGGRELGYDQNNVVFEFALLSYFREEDTRYRTHLVGFDAEPSEWTPDFKKEYTSLPPGDYTFQVWGRDAAGNVSGPVQSAFRILPAPWRTWWAYALYALAAGGLVYLFVLHRVRTLHGRAEELEARIRERTAELADTVEELRRSEQRAVDANRAKTAFLSNMSHELRTPLNAVLGFAQLMDRSAYLHEDDRNNLEIIQRSGEHLLRLINDVLSISKIEAGQLALVEEPFDPRRMLRSVLEMIRVRADAKHLDLAFEIAPGLPDAVVGDEGKLRQVLLNVLGNAVKFTPVGSVTLRARWDAVPGLDGKPEGRALFEIEDTGSGISEEEMGKLFRAFVQTESGLRAQEGTGLGLAISRSIIRLMGGDIRVASRVGYGTTVFIDVRLPEAARVARADRRRVVGLAASERRRRILVADDIRENRLLLASLLRSVGFDVREAANGQAAVDIWQEWRPRLIWMDLRMSGLDGWEATRRIRNDEFCIHHSCKIIALTASALEHDREAVLQAGFDDFVTKPFREETVFEKLEIHIGTRFVYEEDAGPQRVAAASLTPERFVGLDADLFDRFYDALVIGDVTAAADLVESIRSHDGRLAADLEPAVSSFAIDRVIAAMEAARPLRVG